MDIKVLYSKETSEPIYISYPQWKRLKKIIDNEFNNKYGSFKEVRIYPFDFELSIEGHVILNKRRIK